MNTKLGSSITLKTIVDDCSLSVAENITLPFAIERVYYIYQADTVLPRGFHAHRTTRQILFCIAGTIDIVLDNGFEKESVHLEDPAEGITLEPYIWHEMHNFTPETILLVLASKPYHEDDYIRQYAQFVQEAQDRK